MKKFQALLAAVLFCAVAAKASDQSASSGYATVVRVEGIASYSLGDDKWVPLVAGKVLPVGSSIRTGHNGVVDVVLGKDIDMPHEGWQTIWRPGHISQTIDSSNVRGLVSYKPEAEQNVVRLTPETTLGIDKLTVIDTGADTVSDTELDLKKGKIFASVKKLTGASQYLIKLPSGIAGVRGTQFSISVDGASAVFESTGGGMVESMVLPDGTTKTVVVTPGNLFNPASGLTEPFPPDVQRFFQELFSSLQTIYSPVKFTIFTSDNTTIYVSPVHGGTSVPTPPPE